MSVAQGRLSKFKIHDRGPDALWLPTLMPRKPSSKTRVRQEAEPSVLKAVPSIRSVVSPDVALRTPFFARPPIMIGILVTMVVSAAYLWVSQPSYGPQSGLQPYRASSPQVNQPEMPVSVIDQVSEMIVTNGEKPELYSVTDLPAFLSEHPEAIAVEEGDKVLVWADKTVVFSPSKHKIVAVYPTKPPAPPEPELGATVEIRNGSGVNGAAARLKKTVTDGGLIVSTVTDAKTRREGTIVVDMSNGMTPNALSKTIELTGGILGPLPEGEVSSNSSILVIIGR